MDHDSLARRDFFGALSLSALMSKGFFAADERNGDMIYRKLGRTGERVSAVLGMKPMAVGALPQRGLATGWNACTTRSACRRRW